MNRDELLQLLKDIDAPPEPAWWLPGPGHYLLLALLAILLLLAILRRQRRRANYWPGLAASELERISARHNRHRDGLKFARELSGWLRRVSLLAFPGQATAGLVGDDWLDFLDRKQGGESFSRGAGRVFADGIYRQHAAIEAAVLLDLCRHWLRAIEPALRERSGK